MTVSNRAINEKARIVELTGNVGDWQNRVRANFSPRAGRSCQQAGEEPAPRPKQSRRSPHIVAAPVGCGTDGKTLVVEQMHEGRRQRELHVVADLAPDMPRCASVKRSPDASRAWMMVSEPRISVASTLALSGPMPISACSGRMPIVTGAPSGSTSVPAGQCNAHPIVQRQREGAILPADLARRRNSSAARRGSRRRSGWRGRA